MTLEDALRLLVSLAAVLALAGLARWLGLGRDVRIRDEDHARALANEAVFGFDAVDLVLDRAGIGALLKADDGRQMVLRRHGAQFVGRILDSTSGARLDRHFLTIRTGEPGAAPVVLDLGEAAQYWAAGLRHVSVGGKVNA